MLVKSEGLYSEMGIAAHYRPLFCLHANILEFTPHHVVHVLRLGYTGCSSQLV